MAFIFHDNQGVIMVDNLKEGRTINGAYYAEELRKLRQKIVMKRRGKLTRGILLLQDNASAHKLPWLLWLNAALVLPHPPYSPDLAPSDFHLFPKLKTNLLVRNFGSSEGDLDAVNEYLGEQDEDFYFESVSKLK